MRAVERHSYRAGNAAVRTLMTNFLRHVGAVISLGLGFVLACSANAAAQQTIWSSTSVPATVDSGSSGPVELGVSFTADTSGTVTAIRFYKSAANTGLHIGHLWSRTGALLATVTFTGETSSGWQQANLSNPVAITANTAYVASYQTTIGRWSVNWDYIATSGVNNPPLHALQNGNGAPDGVYASAGVFPRYTYRSANFWVDAVFNSAAAVAPSITAQPASQTVTAGQTATFSVTASGTAPLNYQWLKNGGVVSSGPSASYTTAATIATDTGAQFTVAVSNSAGSATSSAATLTVNAATYLLSASPTSLSFGNINTTASSTLAVTLTNSGNSDVTISNVSSSGAGFNPSGVSAGTVLAPAKTATLNVMFAPAATGIVTGNASVTSNATNSPTVISLAGTGVQPPAASFPIWVSPGLVRVGKTDAPGTASSISLSSARGETVDTQVIVQGPTGGLTNVNVSASALTGPGGASIPASSVTLYREYYITVTGTANYGGGGNPPLRSGTYPEPLIPFNNPETGSPLCGSSAALKACNATISAGQNQPYWIDISVPRGATNSPTGTYTGNISVTADQGTVSVPVTLTVWNFELPLRPSELSIWQLWQPASGNTITSLGQALMRNKVMGWVDMAANASSDMTTFGLNRSGLDYYYFIGIRCDGSYSSIPSTSQISAAAANFPTGLPLDLYLADELNCCPNAYTPLKTVATNAHAASGGVKTIIALNAPDPSLYDEGDGSSAIDHWVLLDSLEQWPALPWTGPGDLWSYTSCNTGSGNTPEWMVDYPPINERIQAGFLDWTQGATGILYYRAA